MLDAIAFKKMNLYIKTRRGRNITARDGAKRSAWLFYYDPSGLYVEVHFLEGYRY